MDSIPTTADKNTLIFSSAGSGKSHVLISLVKQYLKLNKKTFLFGTVRLGKAYPHSNQSSYFDFESPLLEKVEAEILSPPCSNFDLPSNIHKHEYDVIIIDDLGLLSNNSLKELFRLLPDRPGTKFVLATQHPEKKYKEIIKYFDTIFIGYYGSQSILLELSELLEIEKNTINICAKPYFCQKFLKIEKSSI